ncbi:MAG: helix-turn-helix domain-containing protein [Planctomycetes bacterium]|nr:helix-turn-helix domain-containing protein [Planctomycetota bacterium]
MSRDLTAEEMAAELGIAATTLKRWVREAGCPIESGSHGKAFKFDKDKVLAWMEKTGATGLMGKPPAGSERVSEEEQTAQTNDLSKIAKLTKVVHLEIKRLEAAKRKRVERIAEGELHDRVDCERATLAKIAAVRTGLLSLPGKLSARLAGREAPDVQRELEREVAHLLAQFAGQGGSPAA